jgi:acyl-CoA synthetase (AMP-forming)/AMP-acid ligase II
MNHINHHYPLFRDTLISHTHRKGDNLACIFQTHGVETAQTLTYRDLSDWVLKRAQLLLSLNHHGQPVALLFPNGLDFVVNFLACLYAGVIAVPLNLPRNSQQMERNVAILDDAKIKTLLTTATARNQLEQQLNQIPALHGRNWTWIDEYQFSTTEIALPLFSPEKLAFIQYTSGSTSLPKGVMVSHGNLVENQKAIQTAYDHPDGLMAGGWLPQFHDMGLIGHMLQPLFMGGTYVFMPPINFVQRPLRWLELISHYRLYSSAAPNFGYKHCVKCIKDGEDLSHLDLSCWQVALNGSEPIDANTMKSFAAKFSPYGFNLDAFSPCYGLAECTLFVSGMSRLTGIQTLILEKEAFQEGRVKTAEKGYTVVNCGFVSASLNVRIVNPESREVCEEGEIGEIWVSGTSVAQGYWKNTEKTEECFQAQLKQPDGKYYLRTGDMGFLHQGMLFITGRIKEMLIVNGRNLYPYDIECTCNDYQDAVGNNGTSVFTIDEEGESKLVAIIEIKRKSWLEGLHAQIIRDIRESVMNYHNIALDKVILVKPGTIPKTTSGKIKRTSCKYLLSTHQYGTNNDEN